MLEQRRAQEKGYITLKEAAEISDYSPDYIGQLIRAGKIKGEQVYSSVAWVTTEEEILAYGSKREKQSDGAGMTVFENPLLSKLGKALLYSVIAVLCACLLLLQYVLYVSVDHFLSATPEQVDVKLAK